MFNIGILGFWLYCCTLLIEANTESDSGEPANFQRGFPTSALDNPRIVEHPQDNFFAKNEPATLNCNAEGDPTPSITWYRNGERVETNKDDPLSHRMLLDKGQLFFLRVIHSKNNHQDIGEYYCNATNIHGSAISRIANIQIAVLKDTFIDEPSDTTTAVGQSVVLHCRPPRGKPEPKVIWRKNSELVQTDDRVTITEEGDLEISSVEKKDIGEYLCLAINTGGERQSKPAQLRVLDVPIFHKLPKDVAVEEGDIAEFFCEVIGDPPITVLWSKESGSISFGRARVLSDRTLRIENVEPSDEGLYICSAENAAGSTQATARLVVYSSPSFLIRPRDQVVARGRTVTLQCVAKGNPPPTIFWKEESRDQLMFPHRDYGRISVTEDGSLRIQAVVDSDAGTYICDALNTKGQSSASAFLKVIDYDERPPPIIRLGPQNQTLPVGSIAVLQCIADGKPEPITRWYKNNRPIPLSDPHYMVTDLELQISNLKMQDSGVYACKAISETGETSWEAFLAVTSDPGQRPIKSTAPLLLPDPPTKPVVSDITDNSVHLSWSPGVQTGQAPVTSFYVEYFGFETTDGWVIASNDVKRESYTVTKLRPNTTYLFLIRAVNKYGVGYPSLLSESIKMLARRPKPQKPKLTEKDIENQLSGVVVEMVNTHSVNSSAISLTWKVTKADDIIEGYQIEYTHILDIMRLTYGDTKKIRVPPTTTTYLVTGLKTYSWYQLRVLAYSGTIQSLYSSPIKVQTEEFYRAGPPRDLNVHRVSDDSVSVLWSPPDMRLRQFLITGYQISCLSTDRRQNCSTSTNGRTKSTIIKRLKEGTAYRIKVAAVTPQGVGLWSEVYAIDSDGIHMVLETQQSSTMKPVAEEESKEEDLFKRSWFVGLLIGVGGVMLWLLLCVFSIWLCKRKKHRKKMKDQRFYSGVPLRKGEECSRNMMYPPQYGIKDQTNCTNDLDLPPELRGLLPSHTKKESEVHDDNIYKVAGDGSFPELKTFYQKVDPVAPYATTALIQQQHLMKQRQQGMENMFRPINQGYIQHSEGSADSCVKPPPSSDSNHEHSHHSHSTTDHNHSDHMSPTSDSGSHSTDDNGLLIKQRKKNNSKKEISLNKQPVNVNWVEMLPPPPEHPPPSECGEPPAYNELRDNRSNTRSPMSPASFSQLSACSCPNPHTQTPISGWNMPVYSDNECPRCHSEKYFDPNTYCQEAYIRRTQSPRTQLLQHVNNKTINGVPHTCSPREAPCGNVPFQYAQSQKGPHSNCATPYGDYSKSNMNRTSQGSHSDNDGQCVPCFQSYKITPKSDKDYRFMHEEWGPDPAPPCHSCEQDSGMGMEEDGTSMERGCQSMLPSLPAGDCVNNSLYPVRQVMSSNVHGYPQRNCDSPISEGADYGADSDLDHSQEQPTFTGNTDQNTDCSSVQSSTCSSGDGTFLTEEDFASAVARAAEMSGLTVVGTTVCDPNSKSKKERRARRQARPVSPGYSTDSNYGSIDVVRKPYPKSARKQQLIEQGKGKYNVPSNGIESVNKPSNMEANNGDRVKGV